MFDQPEDGTEEYEKVRRYFIFIDFLYEIARTPYKKKTIKVKEFHNDLLNKEWSKELPDFYLAWYETRRNIQDDDMEIDYDSPISEVDKRTGKFLYMCYPWAFDAASKARFMNYEGQLTRRRELHNSMNIMNLLTGQNIYLVVQIDREALVEDSLNSLVNAGKELKKPLKVKFKGEPGVDEGGVAKEFFQLLVRQIFDVGYGMFDYNEESKFYWIK